MVALTKKRVIIHPLLIQAVLKNQLSFKFNDEC